MLGGALGDFLRHVRRFARADGEEATDRQLLERFTFHRDQAAFEALVQRHGPLVYRVCLRTLGDADRAADAFQATFLVLARKAGSVRDHAALGSWLYGVAYRVALKARAQAARQSVRPTEVVPMATVDPHAEAARRELRSVLDEELLKLPEKYRAPLVLCYLEGKTNEEAARQLGWTKGTVSGRLARARDLLRGRLARRGLALATATVVAEVLAEEATAAVPPALLTVTAQAAGVFAADPTAAAGAAADLARGALRTMSISKMRTTVMVLMALTVVGGGAGVVGRQVLAQPPGPKADSGPAKPLEVPAVAAPGKGPAEFPALALSTPRYAEKLNHVVGTRSVFRIGLKVKFDGQGGATGELDLDPNRCTYDAFGDVDMVTEMYAAPAPVTLTLLQVADPTGKGRQLFDVQGNNLPVRLRLVYGRATGPHRLLVLDADGKTVRQVLPLEGGSAKE